MSKRKIITAISTLCLVSTLAACSNDAEQEAISTFIPTYSGEVNLDASLIKGNLLEVNGCLAINDGEKNILIVAQEQQKPLIEENFQKGTLNFTKQISLPGSLSTSPASLPPKECGDVQSYWLLGDITKVEF